MNYHTIQEIILIIIIHDLNHLVLLKLFKLPFLIHLFQTRGLNFFEFFIIQFFIFILIQFWHLYIVKNLLQRSFL